MSMYSSGFSAIKVILLVLASGSGYAAVRLEIMVGMALAFIGGSCVFVLWTLLSPMGGLHIESTKLLVNLDRDLAKTGELNALGSNSSRKWMEQSVKSMPTLQFGILHFYVIEKPLLLIVLKIISESIVFLLVNF